TADIGQEPAIAVAMTAKARGGALLPGLLDPGLGDDAFALSGDAAIADHFAESHERQGRHGHLVAAQIDALRIALPGGDGKALDGGEPFAGERQGGLAADLGENGREE